MRLALLTILLLSSAVLYFLFFPARYRQLTDEVIHASHSFLYDKKILVEGDDFISAAQVLALLPRDRSVPYWLFNGPIIESDLLKTPLISRARLERCSFWSWGCFSIRLEERVPAFFALIGERAWIIGEDGGLLRPLSAERLRTYVEVHGDLQHAVLALAQQLKIPVVTGIMNEGASSDVVKARMNYLKRALDLLEKEVGRKVSYLALGVGREIKVRFFGLKLTAIFDLEANALWQDAQAELDDRAKRLKKLIEVFGTNVDRIESVDLTFDKVGVVKTF